MYISHESPISLLNRSRIYNDYDYALVHLFEQSEEYYSFFRSSVLQLREVLLDNSIFELKEAFNSAKYAEWIEKLHPTFYILPDALEDTENTIFKYETFASNFSKYLPKNILRIGVVQGKNYNELVECYKFMSKNADYIAITFDLSFYETSSYGSNKYELFKNGRINFIRNLIADNIWDWNKPHHLLGCSLPIEFKWYRENKITNIRSCDTSNPVMAGLNKIKYSGNLGISEKPRGLLADNLHVRLESEEIDLIEYNIKCFRQIVNG